MSTKPEYAKLQLQAAAWLEKFDPATQTMTLVATVPPGGEEAAMLGCTLIAMPIAGTDPVQFVYSCSNTDCPGACALRWRQTIFGPVYWCECEEGAKAAARKAGRLAKRKPTSGARPRSKSKRKQGKPGGRGN